MDEPARRTFCCYESCDGAPLQDEIPLEEGILDAASGKPLLIWNRIRLKSTLEDGLGDSKDERPVIDAWQLLGRE